MVPTLAGLRVSFQVVEEVRPGDEADARDKQDKADAFNEFIARDGSGCAALDVELRQNGDILQAGRAMPAPAMGFGFAAIP